MAHEIDTISDSLGMVAAPSEITPPSELSPIVHSDSIEINVLADYHKTRESLTKLIECGISSIDGLARLAEQAESPRAYEVFASTLKSIADINISLMQLHRDTKTILHVDSDESPTDTDQTEYVFVGTTDELQQANK